LPEMRYLKPRAGRIGVDRSRCGKALLELQVRRAAKPQASCEKTMSEPRVSREKTAKEP
jgi:hypothetical protein